MRDSNPPPEGLRRANRIGLRTLGQRPQVVGQTRDGEQIFEIRGVRLLLGSTSNQFRRLVTCSECGREVAGAVVLSRRDIVIPSPPTVCGQCSGRVTAWRAQQPVEPDADKVNAVDELVRRATDESAQVLDLAEPEPGFEVATEAAQAEMHRRAADAEAAFTSVSDSTVARLAELEDEVRLDVARLAAVVESDTTQTAALAVSVDSNRAALRQVVDAQAKTDRRLADLEAQSAVPPPAATPVGEALQQPIEEIRSELAEALRVMSSSSDKTAARTQRDVDELRETVSQALAEIRREAAAREQQVQAAVSDLQAMVAALRSDLESSAHAQFDQLAAHAERQGALAASVEKLASAVQGGDRRAEILERRVAEAVERLDDQRRTREGAPTEMSPAGSLLDALDDQLRAVEERLARLASSGPA